RLESRRCDWRTVLERNRLLGRAGQREGDAGARNTKPDRPCTPMVLCELHHRITSSDGSYTTPREGLGSEQIPIQTRPLKHCSLSVCPHRTGRTTVSGPPGELP